MKKILYAVLISTLVTMLPKPIYALDEELPDFFICNYWQDSNNDNLIDDDEYVGIKDSFSTKTDSLITFVGYYHNQKGKEIGIKIYEPDGTLYSNKTTKAEFEPVHVHRWWYDVNNLANAATGSWKVKWYLEGKVIASQDFTISKPSSSNSDDNWDWLSDWWFDDEEEDTDFFVCNKWVDKNKDKIQDRDEFVGEKSSFELKKDATITAVSFWRNKKDKKIAVKIFAPSGKIWYTSNATVNTEPVFVHYSTFNIDKMAGKDRFGKWTVKWYLDGAFEKSINFTIAKASSK